DYYCMIEHGRPWEF
nr:immunoglobulin light chain junction region [Macaca mulatta]